MAQFDVNAITVGVAVSGGMDSMCLLHYMVHQGATVVALTVEHGIRGAESVADAQLVASYCRSLGVPCLCRQVDAPAYAAARRLGLEQAARQLRHAFFAEMLAAGRVDCIATAHHLDDQCETVMLNMLRGSGLRGLGGIEEKACYIRPLLGWTRSQIAQYVVDNSVPYREDGTNSDTAYNRNYLRHEILPLVEARFPAYRQSVARLTQSVRQHIDLLDTLSVAPRQAGDVVYLPVTALQQHPALVRWSIMRALRLFDGGVDFESVHVDMVAALADGKSNDTLNLPHGVTAALEYDDIAFWREVPSLTPEEYPFAEGRFVFGGSTYSVRPWRQGDCVRFDIDKVPSGSVLRLRRAGDTFAKFGGGTKSLGDFYTDRKVPLRVRNRAPVVAFEQQVMVCAVEISRFVAVDATTRRIFTLTKEE